MASQSEKKQARRMQAAHPGIAHADALRRVRDEKTPVYDFQPGQMANGVLPYSMPAEADGRIRRQQLWAGKFDRVVGFLPTNDPEARAGELLRWEEYVTGDPERALGMYLVSASPSDQYATHSTPIVEVEVHDLPLLARDDTAAFDQAIRKAEEARLPVPKRVLWEPYAGGHHAVFYEAQWQTRPGVIDFNLRVYGLLEHGTRPTGDSHPELYSVNFQRGDGEVSHGSQDRYATLTDAYSHALAVAEDLIEDDGYANDDRWVTYWREETRVLEARQRGSEARVELVVSTTLAGHTWARESSGQTSFEAVCVEIDKYRHGEFPRPTSASLDLGRRVGQSGFGSFQVSLDVTRLSTDETAARPAARFEVEGPAEAVDRLIRVLPSRGYTVETVTVHDGDVDADPAEAIDPETVRFTVTSIAEHRFDEVWRGQLLAQMERFPTVRVTDIGGGSGSGVSDHDFEAVGGRDDIEALLEHLRSRYDRVHVWQETDGTES